MYQLYYNVPVIYDILWGQSTEL